MAPISDEDWAELSELELPKPLDPVIQKYLESRRALMAEEEKHRSGNPVTTTPGLPEPPTDSQPTHVLTAY